LYRNALEAAVLSAVFPDGAPPKQRKKSKTAKKPIERMETATYQEFGRSRPKQRKTEKIAEKISHVPSVM
jgi:hypothetical protein